MWITSKSFSTRLSTTTPGQQFQVVPNEIVAFPLGLNSKLEVYWPYILKRIMKQIMLQDMPGKKWNLIVLVGSYIIAYKVHPSDQISVLSSISAWLGQSHSSGARKGAEQCSDAHSYKNQPEGQPLARWHMENFASLFKLANNKKQL